MVRFLRLLAALSLLCSPALPAQLEPLGAPKGTLRFELGGLFQSGDSRYFDGQRQDYLAEFGGTDFGSNRMPFLARSDTLMGRVLGQSGYRLNLGRQRSNGQLTIGSGILGGSLGLTSRLTIFAQVPPVTTRVQASLRLVSTTADAGLNPAEKHPDADRLSITNVNIGQEDLLQIVCGAPNVAKGQKVMVATIGTQLYDKEGQPFTIKKGKTRGVESQGMICAEDELGIGNDHSGITVLPGETPIALPAAPYYKLEDDFVLEVGLTPNRSDATSQLGVARDLLAYLRVNEKYAKKLLSQTFLVLLPKG